MKSRIAFFLIVTLMICSCGSKTEGVITIAVAANMQMAMQEIVNNFEAKNLIKVEMATNSSGLLTSQIMNGAPFELFFSANLDFPIYLYENNKASKPVIYAYGSLVMFYSKPYPEATSWQEILLSESTERIAIANPESAPYGIAAIQALKKAEIYDIVKDKLVFGESVGQVNQYIISNAVDVAFTGNAFVKGYDGEFQTTQIDERWYNPIAQSFVIITRKDRSKEKLSQLFIDYLGTKECKSVLAKHGYSIHE